MALHPWEQKTVEHLTVEEVVAWVEWYTTQRTGPVVFDADTVAHSVLLWGEAHRGKCKDCKMWEVGEGYFCSTSQGYCNQPTGGENQPQKPAEGQRGHGEPGAPGRLITGPTFGCIHFIRKAR